jgi:hypothetical protein
MTFTLLHPSILTANAEAVSGETAILRFSSARPLGLGARSLTPQDGQLYCFSKFPSLIQGSICARWPGLTAAPSHTAEVGTVPTAALVAK